MESRDTEIRNGPPALRQVGNRSPQAVAMEATPHQSRCVPQSQKDHRTSPEVITATHPVEFLSHPPRPRVMSNAWRSSGARFGSSAYAQRLGRWSIGRPGSDCCAAWGLGRATLSKTRFTPKTGRTDPPDWLEAPFRCRPDSGVFFGFIASYFQY